MTAHYVFVDCEAVPPCPGLGQLTEFGAVDLDTERYFYGKLWDSVPSEDNPAVSTIIGDPYDAQEIMLDFRDWLYTLGSSKDRFVLVSDNPAYDYQWINYEFWKNIGDNPFGHSARRISDFYAGLVGDWKQTQAWKKLRITKHDHNPVHDAQGNVEAFKRLLNGER